MNVPQHADDDTPAAHLEAARGAEMLADAAEASGHYLIWDYLTSLAQPDADAR